MGSRNGKARPVRVYKLIPLFREEDARTVELGQPVLVVGEIGEHVIASIPPDMSARTAQDVTEGVRAATGKPVLTVTHNIEFLAVQEIPRKEAVELLKRHAATAAEVRDDGEQQTSH